MTSKDNARDKILTRSSVSRDAVGLLILVTMVSVRRHSALKLKIKTVIPEREREGLRGLLVHLTSKKT